MSLHIVSIGQEILSGDILNTNSEFLAKELTAAGYEVTKMISVSDDLVDIETTLLQSLQEADFVITTGGLGSTLDDETKTALCSIFDDKVVLFPQTLKDLKHRFGHYLTSLEDQATWPSQAILLPNPFGTAPGLFINHSRGRLIALPGVPSQMKAIFLGSALAEIKKYVKSSPPIAQELHFAFLPENDFDPLLRKWKQSSSLEIGIYPHYGHVTVRLKSSLGNHREIDSCVADLKKHFGRYLYSEQAMPLEIAFHEKMIAQQKTFALAESCTGGHFAARLTALAGASQYFLGSLVTYSNESKEKLLGVTPRLIEEFGAVSPECAKQMAQGLLEKIPADFVATITGIAGPSGGSHEKPVGTVWICYGHKDHLEVVQLPYKKNLPRTLLIDFTINWILAKFLTEGLL